MTTAPPRRALIIAGPNGAGKTTFAREFLPVEVGFLNFANADLIAAGLSPFDPGSAAIQAGRVMLQGIADHVARGENFAFETTLAGRGYALAIPRWRALGYLVVLLFLALPTPEVAISRVAVRVRQGGHFVPDDVVRRRFIAGRSNLEQIYEPLVDTRALYDGADDSQIAELNDPWIAGALPALRRARRRAEEIARQTGTPLVLAKDGRPILVDPGPPAEDESSDAQ